MMTQETRENLIDQWLKTEVLATWHRYRADPDLAKPLDAAMASLERRLNQIDRDA